MNVYALVNGLNALCSLVVALILLINRPIKEFQLTYAAFSLLLFAWAFAYFVWGFQTEREAGLFWLKALELPVAFIHTLFLHFALSFSGRLRQHRVALISSYLFSCLLVVIHLSGLMYDVEYVRNRSPFLFWPHYKPGLFLFIGAEIFFVSYAMIILFRTIRQSASQARLRLKYFLFFSILGWCGGITNWFYFFDSTMIPPIGNPLVTIFMLASFYLTFRHDIFELDIFFKKTFLYAFLTLFITMIFTISVIISEQIFKKYAGYNSFLATLLAAATIAALFNPARVCLTNYINRYLYGKSFDEFSNENAQMREELRKQDRMKSVATLAAGMAHEIKNPLTTIKTFTEHLSARRSDPAFLDKFERIVSKEVARVDQTVRQILQYARPAPLRLVRGDIAQVLRETSGLFSAQVLDKRLDLRLYLPDHPLLCLFDPEQIRQALVNLILNAIQATPPGGAIDVSAASSGGAVEIQITDSGPGIPAGDLGRIFDPFFTTKESGSGLGLAIVQGIVREHGGSIRVQSKAPSGTVFTLRFPCPAGQPA